MDIMKKFKTKKFIFTDYEESIIDGLMLGDGHINKTLFRLELISSSFQHLDFIKNNLNKDIWTDGGIHTYHKYDKRINKTLTIHCLASKSNETFYKLRKKWYPENIKIIPNNLKLNRISLLIWFLGDGCLLQLHKKERTQCIKLCTNSFKEEEINNILIPQLLKYHARIKRIEKNAPVIIIPRRYCDLFLNDIGEPPFKDYSHKWNVFPYKNKNIEKNGIKSHTELKEKFIKEYLKNQKVSDIAKKYNVDSNVVIYYCKKAGIYIQGRDNKKYEIKKNNKIIGVTSNLQMFCKEHDLCYTNMISLCNGKIKKYKDYQIRKYDK